MTEITDPSNQNSPGAQDALDPSAAGNGDNRGVKRPRVSTAADDDDDDDDKPGRERRKIDIKFIQDKSRRHITFSKRKAGIMKKAYELSVLTGTQVLLLVVSETGLVYTFTTPKLQPLVTKAEGKNLIQACLNAPEPATDSTNGVDGETDSPPAEDPNSTAHAQAQQQQQHQQAAVAAAAAHQAASMRGAGNPQAVAPMGGYGMTPEQQQQMAYQQYIQSQQQQQHVGAGNYPMPPQGRMGHAGGAS